MMTMTPLHDAAEDGDLDKIGELVRWGVAIDARDDFGWTPLHMAAEHGHIPAIELLVRLGSKAIDARDSHDDTPMHVAAWHCRPLVIEALVRLGSQAIDTPNNSGDTPLQAAATYGRPEEELFRPAAQTLLALGATPIAGIEVEVTEDEAHEIRWRVFFSESFVEKLLRLL